jgi:hypothetical protein
MRVSWNTISKTYLSLDFHTFRIHVEQLIAQAAGTSMAKMRPDLVCPFESAEQENYQGLLREVRGARVNMTVDRLAMTQAERRAWDEIVGQAQAQAQAQVEQPSVSADASVAADGGAVTDASASVVDVSSSAPTTDVSSNVTTLHDAPDEAPQSSDSNANAQTHDAASDAAAASAPPREPRARRLTAAQKLMQSGEEFINRRLRLTPPMRTSGSMASKLADADADGSQSQSPTIPAEGSPPSEDTA